MNYARLRAVAGELMDQYTDLAGKIEVRNGEVSVLIAPSARRALNAFRLLRQLDRQFTGDLVALAGTHVEAAALGLLRQPDLLVAAEADLERFEECVDPSVLLLVAEIVSPSQAGNAHLQKMQDYPAMGIPLHLLIDPRKGTLRVSSDPADGPDGPRYRATHDYVFGDQVKVGDWVIDSGEFKRYAPR
ncbi:Uma2 family endonuclease [Kitasatospora acidiphila]|uniref:Uma2 family endonuclease n=1 Tax=Kitasatospora acidiphila TaxID=2567942 RepID=A0A540W808_9ACTN|nr:Uma2 family endonuclease [Kitasatospora acidiphila]TQF05143.1 Uma2 family endonuclease [Kitasatospora acidiphila]